MRGVKWWVSSATAKTLALSAITELHDWIQCWRFHRSATTPPKGDPMMLGVHAATVNSPSQIVLCVVTVKNTPSATDCIHVPVDETKDDVSESAKLRCRSGANEAETM